MIHRGRKMIMMANIFSRANHDLYPEMIKQTYIAENCCSESNILFCRITSKRPPAIIRGGRCGSSVLSWQKSPPKMRLRGAQPILIAKINQQSHTLGTVDRFDSKTFQICHLCDLDPEQLLHCQLPFPQRARIDAEKQLCFIFLHFHFKLSACKKGRP